MPINLREADRDQLFLLPPSVADWLPENHLAFFVLDVVSELDLDAFYGELPTSCELACSDRHQEVSRFASSGSPRLAGDTHLSPFIENKRRSPSK
jgi:hypothetical protein